MTHSPDKFRCADAAHIVVDWTQVTSEDDFYDIVLPQRHGRNLDALADAWITGGIDRSGPPFIFEFLNPESTRPELIPFRDAVLKIVDESIEENGGKRIHQV